MISLSCRKTYEVSNMRVHVSVHDDVRVHASTSKRYEKTELFVDREFLYSEPLQVVVSVDYPN